MTTKYFSGDTLLNGAYPVKRDIVRSRFPLGTIKRYDSFSLLVGSVSGKIGDDAWMPVTRVISYNENGSKHVCDARCRCAKGGKCECSCGGKFHGIDSH